ncbi:small acid-soluble spore protein Tlp [Tepidibacillus marianensis]|uniref:small acid-soluble spore protein Tlp n=1 Tax=Tepidibacillus marianensis TaxID=3131995 RepID=UPI0030CF055C
MNKPKPDDRSDNAEKLQHMIQNTQENFREAKDYLKANGSEMSIKDKEEVQAKNKRRLESMDGFRAEIQDEVSE